MRFGDFLVKKGKITRPDVEKAVEEQKRSGAKIGEALVRTGLLSDRELADALSEYLGMERIEGFAGKKPGFNRFPGYLAKKYRIFPVKTREGRLHIATTDPLNKEAEEEVRLATGMLPVFQIAALTEINEAVDNWYRQAPAPEGSSKKDVQNAFELLEEYEGEREIHLEPDGCICLRREGLHPCGHLSSSRLASTASGLKILAGIEGGSFCGSFPAEGKDIRVDILPVARGDRIRIEVEGSSPEKKGNFSGDLLSQWGLLLLDGPGEVRSLFREIDQRGAFIIGHSPQKGFLHEARAPAGASLLPELERVLRQNPEAVAVEEFEPPAAAAAVRAAAWCLVLMAVPGRSASSMLGLVLDSGVNPCLLSSVLIGIAVEGEFVSEKILKGGCFYGNFGPDGKERGNYNDKGGRGKQGKPA